MGLEAPYRYPEGRILVFARAPVAGRVKTRLAAVVGTGRAAALYRSWLRTTVERAVTARLAPVELWTTPAVGHPYFAELMTDYDLRVRPQGDGDLGRRMERALRLALEEASFAILIGSDCPLMDGDYLEAACARLQDGMEMVIGPAEDGGYVLLGARRCETALFRDMPWGSERVLAHTRKRLLALGCRWAELDALWDIDTAEDLRRWEALAGQAAVREMSMQAADNRK